VAAGAAVRAEAGSIDISHSGNSHRAFNTIFLDRRISSKSGPLNLSDKGGSTLHIYVGNLSLEITEDELRREFMTFGEVIAVTIMNDKYIDSGQARGYGYVEMTSNSEGKTAIANLEGEK
jgi:RNA recognition motif-containing protein